MLTTSQVKFLRRVWEKVNPPPSKGKGRPLKTGPEQIQDKAKVASDNATVHANPIAVALGLGNCQLGALDPHRTIKRPVTPLQATMGLKREKKVILQYHLTWVAKYGPPATNPGDEYSHRCHQPCCINPLHGLWEQGGKNRGRGGCADGKSHWLLTLDCGTRKLMLNCPHDPCCLSGTVVVNWENPNITTL